MQLEEITAKLVEIDQDTALPLKAVGEIDVEYINTRYPGLIVGMSNYIIAPDGKRVMANIQALKDAGFHCFSTNRSSDHNVPAGRVRTTKGMILVY